jgi:hypothetical protein
MLMADCVHCGHESYRHRCVTCVFCPTNAYIGDSFTWNPANIYHTSSYRTSTKPRYQLAETK